MILVVGKVMMLVVDKVMMLVVGKLMRHGHAESTPRTRRAAGARGLLTYRRTVHSKRTNMMSRAVFCILALGIDSTAAWSRPAALKSTSGHNVRPDGCGNGTSVGSTRTRTRTHAHAQGPPSRATRSLRSPGLPTAEAALFDGLPKGRPRPPYSSISGRQISRLRVSDSGTSVVPLGRKFVSSFVRD